MFGIHIYKIYVTLSSHKTLVIVQDTNPACYDNSSKIAYVKKMYKFAPFFFSLYIFYVLLPYIIYVMQWGRFSQYPAFLSRTAKERDKKYSVKSP